MQIDASKIRLSHLSAEGVRALRTCEAAERLSTVRGTVRPEVYVSLQATGLIEGSSGRSDSYRLTVDGRRLFDQWARRRGGASARGVDEKLGTEGLSKDPSQC